MAPTLPRRDRRRFLRKLALELAFLALPGLGWRRAAAGPVAVQVNPDAPQARALDYHADAAGVHSSLRSSPMQVCANCRFYTTARPSGWGHCSVFRGQLVPAGGWCTAFTPRPD